MTLAKMENKTQTERNVVQQTEINTKMSKSFQMSLSKETWMLIIIWAGMKQVGIDDYCLK